LGGYSFSAGCVILTPYLNASQRNYGADFGAIRKGASLAYSKKPKTKVKFKRLGGNNTQPLHRDKAYRELAIHIGGRDGLKEVATWNSGDPRAQKLLALLDDPAYAQMGVKRLAAEAGIAYPDLVLMIREMTLQQGLLGMFSQLPNILADAAIEAQSGEMACPKCDGAARIEQKGEVLACPRCTGTGKIRTKADKDARNFVGEVAGILGNSPLVQINQDMRRQTAVITSGSTQIVEFEDMVRKSKPWERTLPAANLLEAPAEQLDITEAEVIPDEAVRKSD
jgi:hypothetical protein